MANTTFAVNSRDLSAKTNKMRAEGTIPANIYGAGKDSTSISVNGKQFLKTYETVGDTALLYLLIDDKKKKVPVLIDDVQLHTATAELLHVVFRQVDLKDKITAEVSVEIVGEIDINEAVMVSLKDTVEVEALPTDLPEKFVINVAELTEVGQAITLGDLDYDKETVEIIVGEEGLEEKVILIQEVKEEVEEEPEIVEGEEGAEGEATEEGEAAPKGDSGEASKEEKTE